MTPNLLVFFIFLDIPSKFILDLMVISSRVIIYLNCNFDNMKQNLFSRGIIHQSFFRICSFFHESRNWSKLLSFTLWRSSIISGPSQYNFKISSNTSGPQYAIFGAPQMFLDFHNSIFRASRNNCFIIGAPLIF